MRVELEVITKLRVGIEVITKLRVGIEVRALQTIYTNQGTTLHTTPSLIIAW